MEDAETNLNLITEVHSFVIGSIMTFTQQGVGKIGNVYLNYTIGPTLILTHTTGPSCTLPAPQLRYLVPNTG